MKKGRSALIKLLRKRLLIDADIVIFQFACVNQVEYDWGNEVVSEVISPLEEAITDLELFIEGLKVATGTEDLEPLFCLSTGEGYRYGVLPSYKHNRKDKERPILLDPLREHIKETYRILEVDGLEADDIMGILGSKYPDKYVIATLDKDLVQIPLVWRYNWRTETTDFSSLEEANRFFYTQILTGDTSDGYSGCPSIGDKRAEKILADVDDILNEQEVWQAIVSTYESKGLTEADALVQARVARILRHEDFDEENKEVILWTPTD